MKTQQYKVTCQSCKGSDILTIINDQQVTYKEHTPIISARFRGDLKWGFECLCGQDSRIAPTEKNNLDVLVKNASQNMIDQLAKSLTPKNENKFEMVAL